MTAPASPVEAIGYPHPAIRRLPTTGGEALFLGRRTNGYVMGMDLDESEALLDELWAFATQEQFCYHHRWSVGEVVVWDNRMLMHMRHPFDESKARFMWRTQTKGEAVIPARPLTIKSHIAVVSRWAPHHEWQTIRLHRVVGEATRDLIPQCLSMAQDFQATRRTRLLRND